MGSDLGAREGQPAANEELRLREYAPRSMLRVPEHVVHYPRFEVIDAHNHLGGGVLGLRAPDHAERPVAELLALMDEMGVRTIVDLDGGWGDRLREELAVYQEPYPDRFVVFAGVDYDNFSTDPAFGETEANRLRESVSMGARGLKVWKMLGLNCRDLHGQLIPVNDERLDPLWETAAELGAPVLIHVGDPAAFFQPLDRFNERWEQLVARPEWHFYPPRPHPGQLEHRDFPTFDELRDQLADLLKRHPDTTYIGAHVGCSPEDLGWVSQVMDTCPNFYADISARVAELGRQPYSARDFIMRHQDRVLFGTDAKPSIEVYRIFYRFLETRDEYFDYTTPDRQYAQGRWKIYGLHLPDDVLEKLYQENAERVIMPNRRRS